ELKLLLFSCRLAAIRTNGPTAGRCSSHTGARGNRPIMREKGVSACMLPHTSSRAPGTTRPARHICQEVNGGELASIHSRAEVEFIRNINYTKYHNVWIGLTRDRSYGWGWTDLTSLGFTNWAPGEPNEAFHDGDVGKENCVEMYHDGTWNDNNCVQKRGFVCRHRQCTFTSFTLRHA
uniref:C-type lectin domain-containing protein n=1 Tax=Cyprinus carpio TaxID=7962 RepID=A0A8C2IHI8_CYPCA